MAAALDYYIAKELGAYNSKDLEIFQKKRLLETLHWAYAKSSFYGRLLKGYNLNPKNQAEWADLPFTKPKDLEALEDFLCTSQSSIERVVTLKTSGTLGKPKRVAFEREDLLRTEEFFAAGFQYLLKPGQSLMVLLPGGERPLGVVDLLAKALKGLNCKVINPPTSYLQALDLKPLLSWLKSYDFNVLLGSPSLFKRLLSLCPKGFPKVQGIMTSTELLSPALRKTLTESWNVELLDHYGLTEAGYGLAVECLDHTGYHLRSLDFWVEIVSLDDQRVLPQGEIGEIVITTLRRKTMPLIRYRTGDVGQLLWEPCGCGSQLPRLGNLLGRVAFSQGGWQWIHKPKGGSLQL
ncbi:MAG: phenylacetate--CoA ligase family protein [Desulfovibrionaceae bacterium]|nr:phenylacetate--CoA ligase family protein [Desulfovibrionaceae bacterium]